MKRSPLRRGYLVRHPALNAWLRLQDLAFRLVVRSRMSNGGVKPRRVLLAVGGHLGDAVLATGAITYLRSVSPELEIGVLTGSWNHRVLSGHDTIKWLHAVDHWKASREPTAFFKRWSNARRTATRALRDIQGIGYDAAFDLSPYFPNSAVILWRAGIPTRVGFTTGGGGPLYTHPVPWQPGHHVIEDHVALLSTVFPGGPNQPRLELPPLPSSAEQRARDVLRSFGISEGIYAVLHLGAGLARKEWQTAKWSSVARSLIEGGVPVVLTGVGPREAAMTSELAATVACANLCDALDWDEFRAVIAAARVVVSVDTAATHVAAAEGVPCVALMTAMDDPGRWGPSHKLSSILTHDVPCAPCYRSAGCHHMSCIQGIEAADVVMHAREYVEAVQTR